jgi:glucokinase
VILVGDIGGTNVRLAIAHRAGGSVRLEYVTRLPVRDFPGLEEAVAAWQAQSGVTPRQAVFALAGPTGADEVRFVNSPWIVRASALKARFGFHSVTLVNDFAAQARAAPATPEAGFETLIEGSPAPGAPMVVLGPGTGLGLAILAPGEEDAWRVLATEGGHQAFAPMDARERAILEHLAETRASVSFEDLCSGKGLALLYATLAALRDHPGRLDGAPEIGRAATAGDDPLAVEAAETLALILATFAGDAVLAAGAKGGCIIAGGVAEALAQFLRAPAVYARFLERGAASSYLAGVPLKRARNAFAALEGAAFFAAGA